LRMYNRDGLDIGRLVWMVCDTCRVGSINKISIDPQEHRKGLGRRMVLRALADGPGYAWQTTHQSPAARLFFPALAKETGMELTQYGGACRHLKRLVAPLPGLQGQRLRPVLQRTV
jgi:hypothetical protein